MFNLKRFGAILAHIHAKSPIWYYLLPIMALLLLFGVLMIDSNAIHFEPYRDTGKHFFTSYRLTPIMLFANSISLSIVSIHLVSSYFKNDKNKTDSLLIPASRLEKFLAFLLIVVVVIPMLGYLSSVVFFFLLKTTPLLSYFPKWGWMWDNFAFSLIIYMALAIPFLASSLLQSKNTILASAATIIAIYFIVFLFRELDYFGLQNPYQFVISDIAELPTGDDLYGPVLPSGIIKSYTPLSSAFKGTTLISFHFISLLGLFISSAWFAFKNRQV